MCAKKKPGLHRIRHGLGSSSGRSNQTPNPSLQIIKNLYRKPTENNGHQSREIHTHENLHNERYSVWTQSRPARDAPPRHTLRTLSHQTPTETSTQDRGMEAIKYLPTDTITAQSHHKTGEWRTSRNLHLGITNILIICLPIKTLKFCNLMYAYLYFNK